MTGQRWTESEDCYVEQNYRELGPGECAKHLGRTRSSVENRASLLNVKLPMEEAAVLRGKRSAGVPRGTRARNAVEPAERDQPTAPSSVRQSDFIQAPSLARLMGGK